MDRNAAFTVHYRMRHAELEGILNIGLFKTVSERMAIRNVRAKDSIGVHPRMVDCTNECPNKKCDYFLQDKTAERFAARRTKCALDPASQAESETALQRRFGIIHNFLIRQDKPDCQDIFYLHHFIKVALARVGSTG